MITVSPMFDIGALQRLKIRCVSETGWFDTATVFGDIRDVTGVNHDFQTTFRT
ncbi:MAG: hypothetical protein P9F75_06620 [Candidatus Contendobacter sp.]|nr:hypothetical protein [Candidatus Contendobacter sp.]